MRERKVMFLKIEIVWVTWFRVSRQNGKSNNYWIEFGLKFIRAEQWRQGT
jgi:hypothetical protein